MIEYLTGVAFAIALLGGAILGGFAIAAAIIGFCWVVAKGVSFLTNRDVDAVNVYDWFWAGAGAILIFVIIPLSYMSRQ